MNCRLHFVLASLALGGAALAAQQPATPTFRSRVDAIEVEMRVLDQNGRPVTDVDVSEVEVLEDERRQQIVAFTRVSVPSVPHPVPSGAPDALPPPDVTSNRVIASSRIFVLILDDLHVDRRNTNHVKKAARRFVEQHVQPGDLISVVFTGTQRDSAQDFTYDRTLALAAIDKFVGRKLPPATTMRVEQYNTLFRARGRPQFEDLRDPYDAERAYNARAAMGAIESVSAVLARVTGRRKAALLFSEGVDYDLSGLRSRGKVGGASAGPTVLPSNAPTGGSETDALGRLDVHSYAHDVLLSIQAAIGAASRANVALYTLDAHGGDGSENVADLGAPVEDPGLGLTPQHVMQEMRDAQEGMTVLAADTGGFAALVPSDYDTAFARIVRESSEYYLVAYSPWNIAPDGTYRDVTVRVKRPGVRVVSRRGYYASREPLKRPFKFVAPGISEETAGLVMAPVPAAGLALDVNTIAFKRDSKEADVLVTAHVEGRELAPIALEGRVTNTLEQALIAIDSAGRLHAATGRAIEIKLEDAAARRLDDTGYRVISRVRLPPGRYQIRQAVRERSAGRHGSVFADIEVPDFSKGLTMSGILLTSARANAVPTSIDPDTYKEVPVLPSVQRRFTRDDELIAMAEIYDKARDKELEVVTAVVDAAGIEYYRRLTRVAARELRASGGTYRHAVQIPLKGLSGDLVLTVDVGQRGSRPATSRRVRFTVDRPHGE